MPPMQAPDGRPVSAVRGLLRTLLALLRQEDVSHVGCAFDHVVESFRNEMFAGYKTGEGIPEDLLAQFELAERAVASLGIVVWPMVEFEADDAMATAAYMWRDAPGVEQVVICSPDKDLAQMVTGQRVVCLDRRKNVTIDEAGVREKIRSLSRVHTRLPGLGRRFGRRHSRHSQVGSQNRGPCLEPLHSH